MIAFRSFGGSNKAGVCWVGAGIHRAGATGESLAQPIPKWRVMMGTAESAVPTSSTMNSPFLLRTVARLRILSVALPALAWLPHSLVAAPSPWQAEFTPAGRWAPTAWAVGVELAGNLAYIAEGPSGLTILNLDSEGGLGRVGGFNTAGEASQVRGVGTKAGPGRPKRAGACE